MVIITVRIGDHSMLYLAPPHTPLLTRPSSHEPPHPPLLTHPSSHAKPLAQVLAAVKNSDAQIAKWAKSSGYCGNVELSAVQTIGANPSADQTYVCNSQKGKPVKQLCCDRSLV